MAQTTFKIIKLVPLALAVLLLLSWDSHATVAQATEIDNSMQPDGISQRSESTSPRTTIYPIDGLPHTPTHAPPDDQTPCINGRDLEDNKTSADSNKKGSGGGSGSGGHSSGTGGRGGSGNGGGALWAWEYWNAATCLEDRFNGIVKTAVLLGWVHSIAMYV